MYMVESCRHCKTEFEITEEDRAFYNKIDVLKPLRCPECRQQNRILFRNFKTLYKSNSSLSGKEMISMYVPGSSYAVYTHDEWWSDQWDPKSYGVEIDFSRPFFEQFQELLQAVPRFNLMNTKSENCLYSNIAVGSKNCYLVFGCIDDENCHYGHIVWNSKDCFDTLYTMKSELCYECIDCINCYRVFYSQDCDDCSDSIGIFDCRNCTYCIGCVGLSKKSHHLFNKPVSKDEYEAFLQEHPLSDPKTLTIILLEQQKLRSALPQRPFFGQRNEDVSGNHIYNAKNIHYSFDVKSGENSKYIFTGRTAIGCNDCSFFTDCELGYQNLACMGRMIMCSHMCVSCNDIWYSDSCFTSSNLFGCVGLRGAKNCILNTQYSQEEFTQLKARLVEHMKMTGEWGEFLPPSLSPFAYNESIVNEYMSLTKEEAVSQGFRWSDDLPGTTGQETMRHEQLPSDPNRYTVELSRHILSCNECKKNYKLIPQEIEFYVTYRLSLPQLCFNCRHMKRMSMRNPRKLWHRQCMCDKDSHDHEDRCAVEFETTYAPDRQEIIYCEQCYQKEVI